MAGREWRFIECAEISKIKNLNEKTQINIEKKKNTQIFTKIDLKLEVFLSSNQWLYSY